MQSAPNCCRLSKFTVAFSLLIASAVLIFGLSSLLTASTLTDSTTEPPTTGGTKEDKPSKKAGSDDGEEAKETSKVVVGRGGKAIPSKGGKKVDEPEYNKLTAEEKWVLLNKGTEYAFTGKYTDHFVEGTYICKRCNAPLYKSDDKFHSGCGWPAFDDEIKDSILREVDADGFRVEIMCKNCGGHLGHVFNGEQMTKKNTRHCVNSISIKFVPKGKELPAVISNKKSSEEKTKNEDSTTPKKSEKTTDK